MNKINKREKLRHFDPEYRFQEPRIPELPEKTDHHLFRVFAFRNPIRPFDIQVHQE